jgi:hypothetical protein
VLRRLAQLTDYAASLIAARLMRRATAALLRGAEVGVRAWEFLDRRAQQRTGQLRRESPRIEAPAQPPRARGPP